MPITFTSDTAGTYSNGDPFTLTWTVEALTHAPPLPAAECLRQMVMGRYNAAKDFSVGMVGIAHSGTYDNPFANGKDPSGRGRLRAARDDVFATFTGIRLRFARTSALPALPTPDGSGRYWFADPSTIEMYTNATLLEDAGHTAIEPRFPSAPAAVQLYQCLAILEYHWSEYDADTGLYALSRYTAEP